MGPWVSHEIGYGPERWVVNFHGKHPSEVHSEGNYRNAIPLVRRTDMEAQVARVAAEKDAEIVQLLRAERERAAKAAQAISDHYYALRDAAENDVDAVAFDERMVAANECAKAIRALPDEEGKKS